MIIDRLTLATNALRWSGAGVALRKLQPWPGLLVLNYHRIGDPTATDYDRAVFSASQEAFAEQVRFLKRNCDVLSPADIPAVRQSGRGLHVLLTFDDGYRDNYDLALPALRAHGVPATFFICTGYLDEPRLPWWDEIAWMIRTSERTALPVSPWFPQGLAFDPPEREAAIGEVLTAYKRLPGEQTAAFVEAIRAGTERDGRAIDGRDLWMTWEMVRELRDSGMTIGAHTVRHQLLSKLPVGEQATEIIGSRDRIAQELGMTPTAFAYPIGKRSAFTEETKRLLAEHGFSSGFSFYGGMQPFTGFDPFDIRRTNVAPFVTPDVVAAMTALPRVLARW